MPRVLIAGHCSVPGPSRAGVQLMHVVRALSSRFQVDVLVVRRGDQAYVERKGQARILRVPVSESEPQARVETFRRALRRQLEGADYDAVHFRDGWAGRVALEMREQLRYAMVFDAARSPLVGADVEDPSLAASHARDLEACLTHADLVLAPTDVARQYFLSVCGPDKVFVAPVGVDVDAFDWEEFVPGEPGRLLYVGPVAAGRGIEVLLEAISIVAPKINGVLRMVGGVEPGYRETLEGHIKRLELTDRVELADAVPVASVPEHIAAAHVCVAPMARDFGTNPTEVYPTKILEYLACRRPVIAPRTSTVALVVRDRHHGLLFEPGDASSLAECIQRYWIDDELRQRVAQAGYTLVRRDHTASSTRRAIRGAYSWLGQQAPWSERWNRTDDLSERAPAGKPLTGSLVFATEQAGATAPAPLVEPFTGEQPIFETGVDGEDHTMVEAKTPPRDKRFMAVQTQVDALPPAADRWVVKETNQVREESAQFFIGDSGEPGTLTQAASQNRFVAGEIGGTTKDGGARPADDDGEHFTAVGAPLGARTTAKPGSRGTPLDERKTEKLSQADVLAGPKQTGKPVKD